MGCKGGAIKCVSKGASCSTGGQCSQVGAVELAGPAAPLFNTHTKHVPGVSGQRCCHSSGGWASITSTSSCRLGQTWKAAVAAAAAWSRRALGALGPSLCSTAAFARAGMTERQLAPTRSACAGDGQHTLQVMCHSCAFTAGGGQGQ